MSRTFRNIKIKPSKHIWLDHKGNQQVFFFVETNNQHRSSVDLDEINEYYKLYRDKQFTSYKHYRKFDEQRYKTFMKVEIIRAIRENDDVQVVSNKKIGSGYWD